MAAAFNPEGCNLDDYKGFKYIDDDSASECSEYSYFEDFVSDTNKKKPSKTFRTVMTKEAYLPE